MQDATLIDMPAMLVVTKEGGYPSGYLWRTARPCPLCGLRRGHVHGGGQIPEDPRRHLGPRANHCADAGDGTDYSLYDADPAATTATIAEARAKLTQGVEAGAYHARRIMKRTRRELEARTDTIAQDALAALGAR